MIAILTATLALAADQPATSNFPELSAAALAPAVIQDLKRTLPDPYSIRDLTICEARQLKLKDGRPFTWTVEIGLNAKGPSGGFTGLARYVITFKEGAVKMHAFSGMTPGDGASARILNNHALNRIIDCPRVPDARVQELLNAPPRNTGN